MEIRLSTNRLLLRRFAPSDVEDVFSYTGDAAVMRYIEPPFLWEEAERFVQSVSLAEKPPVYALWEKQLGRVIGHAIFHPLDSDEIYELGWIIGTPYQQNGYASEIGQALLAFGFERMGLHKICAETVGQNLASIHTMRKLGMTREAVLRRQVLHQGEWMDVVWYGILKEEYDAGKANLALLPRKEREDKQ